MMKQLDVFGSFTKSGFHSDKDVITSVLHAFCGNPSKGISADEFENFICELCKSPYFHYHFEQETLDVIKRLVYISRDELMTRESFELVWKYWAKSILNPKPALLVLNMQNDFLHGQIPGLSETNANLVINNTNFLVSLQDFEVVIYVLENHPPNHISFIDNVHLYKHVMSPCQEDTLENEGGHSMDAIGNSFEVSSEETSIDQGGFTVWDKVNASVDDNTSEMMLWPRHCVKNTWGSELSSQLHIAEKTLRVYTGTTAMGESCSPFWEWEGVVESSLEECLRINGITDVYICGVPTDISGVPTALDCLNHGLRTVFVSDASVGLDEVASGMCESLLRAQGVAVVNSERVPAMLRAEDRRPEQMLHSAVNFAHAFTKLNLMQRKQLTTVNNALNHPENFAQSGSEIF